MSAIFKFGISVWAQNMNANCPLFTCTKVEIEDDMAGGGVILDVRNARVQREVCFSQINVAARMYIGMSTACITLTHT